MFLWQSRNRSKANRFGKTCGQVNSKSGVVPKAWTFLHLFHLTSRQFLPSDLDIMFAKRPCKIIGNKEVPLFDVEYDQSDPRYVKLRMTEGIENQNISASVYVNNASQLFPSSMPPVYQWSLLKNFGYGWRNIISRENARPRAWNFVSAFER